MTDKKQIYDMLIIGGGPAGYTAALYASRAGLQTLLLEKLFTGGQMNLTSQIDNYPGFEDGIDGFTLGEKMKNGAEKFGTETLSAEVLSADLKSFPKVIHTAAGDFYGRTVVIASGAVPKELGLPKEQELIGRGLSYCASCDGMFYRNKTVVVVGGGNTAAADALTLSRICKKVFLVHRRDTLRATRIYHEPLKNAENIEILWNSTVSEFLAEDTLSGVKIQNILTKEERELSCDGVFLSIGRKPAAEFVRDQLPLDHEGYIWADESTKTELPGVYAAGDVRTKKLRQIITAASDGALAAHEAEEYLAKLK